MLKLGKDTSFYVLLEGQAKVAHEAALEFLAMARDLENLRPHIDKLRDIEHNGDDLTHELQTKVVATFITPLDKEDLRSLSQALDDVTDVIEAAAVRAELYGLSKPRPEMVPLVELLVRATQLAVECTHELQNGFGKSKVLREKLKEIHTVENESDTLFRGALANLFGEATPDALYVIKWKEMFDRIEAAVDKCEDIAKIIENVIIKYG